MLTKICTNFLIHYQIDLSFKICTFSIVPEYTHVICGIDSDIFVSDERRLPTRKSEGGGFLRLSNFTKQISAESEREKKISQLSPEMVELLDVKRKDLELVYTVCNYSNNLYWFDLLGIQAGLRNIWYGRQDIDQQRSES